MEDGVASEELLNGASLAIVEMDRGYGIGWWTIPPEENGSIYLYVDPGLYGSVSWIDVDRGYGGVVLFEEYTAVDARKGSQGVINELIPIIEAALDEVR